MQYHIKIHKNGQDAENVTIGGQDENGITTVNRTIMKLFDYGQFDSALSD